MTALHDDFDDEFPDIDPAQAAASAFVDFDNFDDHEPELAPIADPVETDEADETDEFDQVADPADRPDPAVEAAAPSILPPDWDFTFVAPDPQSPRLLEATRLALAILKRVKVTRWVDLPEDTWRLFEQFDVLLSEGQVALLDEFDHLLGFVAQSIAKRGDTPGVPGVPGVQLAVCPMCAENRVASWKLVSGSVGGHCALDASHDRALLKPSAVKTTEAARRSEAKAAAEAAAEAAKAAQEGEQEPEPDTAESEPATAEEDQGELDFG